MTILDESMEIKVCRLMGDPFSIGFEVETEVIEEEVHC